jgi:DNA-binding response OmpR family regulator
MSRILLVEDESHIAQGLRFNLEAEGHAVEIVQTGEDALQQLRMKNGTFDLMILDVMLPGKNGFAVARELRQQQNFIPILMLTARARPEDVLHGFESGADDYLPKPFKFKELLARTRAVLRRRTTAAERVMRFGPVALNRDTREVFNEGRPVTLTVREFDLLEWLMLHPRQVLTRDTLLDHVWGPDYLGAGNLVEVYISSLRDKLGDAERQLIRTVRGVGYALSG